MKLSHLTPPKTGNVYLIVEATLYYGHVDDPHPLEVMGRVVFDLFHMPWKKLIGVPWSEIPLAKHGDIVGICDVPTLEGGGV